MWWETNIRLSPPCGQSAMSSLRYRRKSSVLEVSRLIHPGRGFIRYIVPWLTRASYLVRLSLWCPSWELFWVIVTFATAAVKNPYQLYACRFLVGLAEGTFYPAVHTVLGGWYTKHGKHTTARPADSSVKPDRKLIAVGGRTCQKSMHLLRLRLHWLDVQRLPPGCLVHRNGRRRWPVRVEMALYLRRGEFGVGTKHGQILIADQTQSGYYPAHGAVG